MILKEIRINNFRSIPKDTSISLTPMCRVLIGINESGKSNILKAASLLDTTIKIDKEDIREPLPYEDPIKESEVLFVFQLEDADLKKIFESLKDKILSKKYDEPILKTKSKLKLFDFMKNFNEVLYEVDLIKGERKPLYWSLSDDYTTDSSNWKKPSEKCPEILKLGEEQIKLKSKLLINTKDYQDIPSEYLDEITPKDVAKIVGDEYIAFLEKNLPRCIFWKYSDENLLPSKIDLSQFSSNPDTCIPLKYMFNLAGHRDIPKAFQEAKERNQHHGVNNLLENVALQTTKFFRDIWKDYKDIEFLLIQNGGHIDAAIKEKNRHGFDRRSDGFKRFVTFLLMVSTKVKSGDMKNAVLIVDEPDMGLHITAEEYLKRELIKISKNNYVIYSTHSIFMIDEENISRHIIVKKTDEKTELIEAKESNIFDEEVLYNAMGYSVFRNLKDKNIMFEGWRDKKLFQTSIKKIPIGFNQSLKTSFHSIGQAHSKGTRFMQYILPIMEFANRKCLILSDSDGPAKRDQEDFHENNLHGCWKRYDEIIENASQITGEDFIVREIIIKIWNNLLSKYNQLTKIEQESDLDDPQGVIFLLKKKIKEEYTDQQIQKEILNEFKEELFSNLKPSHINETYYNYLSKVSELIESM